MSYFFFANEPFLAVAIPVVTETHVVNILFYIFLGIFFGFCSALFIRGVYFAEDLFKRIHDNYYVRHILGMLIIGCSMYGMMVMFGHYYVQGLGYATVYDVLRETITHPYFLLFLALLKMLNTAISLGSGASGGIFSPLVFIGATLGGSLAGFFPHFSAMNLPLYAMAGIAGMIGASTGAPIMAIVMAAELTNNMSALLPLIVIVAIASGVRRCLIKDSIFTYDLMRQGRLVPDTLQRIHVVM